MGLANDRTGLVMWKIIPRAWKDVVNCLKKKANKPKLMKKLTVIIYKTNKKKQ